jgi:sortase A
MSASRIIEVSAWVAGAMLLATYVGVRTWSARASDAGVNALREARAQQALLAQAPQTTPNSLAAAKPDTSLWDAKRLAQYRQALATTAMPEAVLRIPRLALEVPVYEGTSDSTLNRGAGRIVGTAAADSVTGNIGIAAHRDGFFRPLKDIEIGDTLSLETLTDEREYRVTRLDIVDPDDVSVLRPTSGSTVTLVTCYPFYYVGAAPKRYIVTASLASVAPGPDVAQQLQRDAHPPKNAVLRSSGE